MKTGAVALVAVVVAVVSITMLPAQIAPTGSSPVATSDSNDVEQAQTPRYGVLRESRNTLSPGAPPEPVPIQPVPVYPSSANTFEFIGVTDEMFTGDRGVLNFTMACQRQFGLSRMCTVDELLNTLNVPRGMHDVHAWIRPEEHNITHASDGSTIQEPPDCVGWTSASPSGLGFALRFSTTCVGGIVELACDSTLAVACCAPAPRE